MEQQESNRFGSMACRHLHLSAPKMKSLIKLRAKLFRSIRDFFDYHSWTEVTVPTIATISGSCEDYSTAMSMDFYGRKAFLIQTGQLFMEAVIAGIDKIYSINHSYRGEKKLSPRHLTEFLLVEAEAVDHCLDDIMLVIENLIDSMNTCVIERCRDDMDILSREYSWILNIKPPFPRITYTEAVQLMKNNGIGIEWGQDLKQLEEEYITNRFGGPVFVTHFPKEIKFFNMREDPMNFQVVLSCDLLVPVVGEILGASEREHDYEKLRDNLHREKQLQIMLEMGGKIQDYDWYLELRKFRTIPHSGFGLGFERYIRWICRFEDIADAIEFPRKFRQLSPGAIGKEHTCR